MNLQSLGHAASIYQRDPREIEAALAVVQAEAAEAAGQPIPHEAKPSLRLNGIGYFDSDEVARAVGWLVQRDAQRAEEAIRS